jgi:cytochrome c peroxidase
MLMPIQDRDELGSSSLADLEKELGSTDYYAPLFLAAFNDSDVTADRIARALAQFTRSLLSYRSKWDRANYSVPPAPPPDPTSVLTAQERRGFQVYGDAQCFWCHQMSRLDSPEPQNNGLDAATSTDEPGARLFRVASLRNIAVSAPYMHDGRFATLRDVIDHYSTGMRKNPNLGIFLRLGIDGTPRVFNLSEEDKQALEAFFNTMTDTEFLNDPKFSDPFQ